MAILNNPIIFFKLNEFRKAINSIDCDIIVNALESWGKKYFKSGWKEYMDEVRRFLAVIVQKIGDRI